MATSSLLDSSISGANRQQTPEFMLALAASKGYDFHHKIDGVDGGLPRLPQRVTMQSSRLPRLPSKSPDPDPDPEWPNALVYGLIDGRDQDTADKGVTIFTGRKCVSPLDIVCRSPGLLRAEPTSRVYVFVASQSVT